MAFGRKTGSLKKLKESLAKGGNGIFIKYVPKNGEMNVRFIQEPEEWVAYAEHYDELLKQSYPCNGEASCPGCSAGERKTARYLANAVNLDDQDRVMALQLPKTLANRLVVRYEKWGSLTNRDIELSRTGEGTDTQYDFDAGAVDRKNIAKYQPLDLLDVLEKVYDSVFGAGVEDDDEDDKPAVKKGRATTASTRRRAKVEEPEEDEDDEPEEEEDEPEEEPVRPPRRGSSRRKAAPEPEPEEDEDPEEDEEDDEPAPPVVRRRRAKVEPEPEPEPEEDEDEPDAEEYNEEDLLAMTLGRLRGIAREFRLDPKGKDKEALIDLILDGPAPY